MQVCFFPQPNVFPGFPFRTPGDMSYGGSAGRVATLLMSNEGVPLDLSLMGKPSPVCRYPVYFLKEEEERKRKKKRKEEERRRRRREKKKKKKKKKQKKKKKREEE